MFVERVARKKLVLDMLRAGHVKGIVVAGLGALLPKRYLGVIAKFNSAKI